MSRGGGFPAADIATNYFRDPKVRRLVRTADANIAPRALVLHLATVLASWEQGERVRAEDAAPDWLPLDDGTLRALQGAGLLDRQHRIPTRSWSSWYKPAFERRETLREHWRRANRKRRDHTRKTVSVSESSPQGDREETTAPVPYRNSKRDIPTSRVRTNNEPQTLVRKDIASSSLERLSDVLLAKGFRSEVIE